MQPQRASHAGDGDQPIDEVRGVAHQLGELVDDHHQPGQGLRHRALPVPLLVGADVVHSGLVEQPLAPVHLRLQCYQRTLGQVAAQVGDHAQGVGQVGQSGEGPAPLEVHQHETHVVGVVGERQCDHQGLQQLALARPGGPGDQSVRAVTGVVEVQDQWLVAAPHPDGHPQVVVGVAATPGPGGVPIAHVGDAHHLQETDAGGEDAIRLERAHPQRGEAARQALTEWGGGEIGLAGEGRPGRASGGVDQSAVGLDLHHRAASGGHARDAVHQEDRRGVELAALGREQQVDRRVVAPQRVVLDQQHQPRPAGPLVAVLRTVEPVLAAVQLLQEALEHLPRRLRVVGQAVTGGGTIQRAGVREPLEPLPFGDPLR